MNTILAIKSAIKDAQEKDKLCLVTAITTIQEKRLIDIMNGAEMTLIEYKTLGAHIS